MSKNSWCIVDAQEMSNSPAFSLRFLKVWMVSYPHWQSISLKNSKNKKSNPTYLNNYIHESGWIKASLCLERHKRNLKTKQEADHKDIKYSGTSQDFK